MKSRYDLMEFSSTRANDGTYYPDVMTFKISKFRFTETPHEYIITQVNIKRKDLLVYNYYNETDFDDIVLWLNKISDYHQLNIGDTIFIPTKSNIEEFYLRNRI